LNEGIVVALRFHFQRSTILHSREPELEIRPTWNLLRLGFSQSLSLREKRWRPPWGIYTAWLSWNQHADIRSAWRWGRRRVYTPKWLSAMDGLRQKRRHFASSAAGFDARYPGTMAL